GGAAQAGAVGVPRRDQRHHRQARRVAGADDEHHQRRRPCRQQRRRAGVHGAAGGRGQLRRGAARRRGDLPRAEERAEGQGPEHRGRRRGRLAPNLRSNIEALDTILEAVNKAGYKIGSEILLGLDAASSEFFKNGMYDLEGEGKVYTPEQWVDVLAGWARQYPIVTIEDGMAEGDWA